MGTDFRKLRNKTGMNMRQAAEFFGTPYATWRCWESGKTRTPKIAEFAVRLLIQRNDSEKDYIKKMITKMDEVKMRS